MQKHKHFYYTTNEETKYILFTMTGYMEGPEQINKVLQNLSDKTITFPTENRLITKGQKHNEPFIHASLATLFLDNCQNNDFTMPSYAMVNQQPIGFLIDKDKCKLLNAYKHDTGRLNASFDSDTGENRKTKKYDDSITIDDFANIYRKQDNHYKNIEEKKQLNIKEQAMVKGNIQIGPGLHNELHLTSIKENEKIEVYSIFLSLIKNNVFYPSQLKNLAISLTTIIDKQIEIFGLDTIPLHFVEEGKKIGIFKTLTLKELIIFCEKELKDNLTESKFNDFIKKHDIDFEYIKKYLDTKLNKKKLQTIQEKLKREHNFQKNSTQENIQKQLENNEQQQKLSIKKINLKPRCIGNNNKKNNPKISKNNDVKQIIRPNKKIIIPDKIYPQIQPIIRPIIRSNKKIIIPNKNNNVEQIIPNKINLNPIQNLQKKPIINKNNNMKQIIPNKIYQPLRPIIRPIILPTIQNNFILQPRQQIIPRKNHLQPIQSRYRLQKKPIINKDNNMQQLQKFSRNNNKSTTKFK